ncbi:MAG: UDP-3-O-(3-hydroxymyristoyl)glucosamine N-acyltransferase [Planctomycetes bacterium]|nr:UDP-3-O-(3-hydroxymyristoyl)glucosamine N-acyltransferase [Planctomycetota bacterium]
MKQLTLGQIAKIVKGKLTGDPNKKIRSVKGLSSATADDISFFCDQRFRDSLKSTKASCIIMEKGIQAHVKGNKIVVANASEAVANLCEAMFDRDVPEGISDRSYIHKTSKIGRKCYIGDGAVIEGNVEIGENTLIYPFVFIGKGSRIGPSCTIYPNVVIYHDSVIGDRVVIHAGTVIGSDGFGYLDRGRKKILQIGIVEIENDVEIGSNVSIDRARLDKTIIGSGTKIDNLVHIAHNVVIGKNCLILAQVGLSGGSIVENNAILGGQVGVGEKVKIGAGAIVYHQAGATKNVKEGDIVMGTPAFSKNKFLKMMAVLSRIADKKGSDFADDSG